MELEAASDTVLIVLNPRSGGGRARARFERLRPSLPNHSVVELGAPGWDDAVRGARSIPVLAAGGDGTVRAVVDAALSGPPGEPPLLGAIGLGSSNDVHKPGPAMISRIPVRMDWRRTALRDVGRVVLDGTTHRFVNGVSLGATADAAASWEAARGVRRTMQARAPSLGAVVAGLDALLEHRSVAMSIAVDGGSPQEVRMQSLVLAKTPHLAGSLSFGVPIEADDGALHMFLLRDGGKVRLLRALFDLARSRFVPAPGRELVVLHSCAIRRVDGASMAVDVDGESFRAERIDIRVEPRSIRWCGPGRPESAR